jgi:hypothetical protein
MMSIKGALHAARVRLAPGRSGDSASKAERVKRRAEAEAIRREHKRETWSGGGSGGGV